MRLARFICRSRREACFWLLCWTIAVPVGRSSVGAEERTRDSAQESGAISETAARPRFAYFFGWEGQFLKIKLDRLLIDALWSLSDVQGLDGVLPHTVSSPGAAWRPEQLQYDRFRGRLYGTFPKPEGFQPRQDQYTHVVVLQLPTMDVVGTIAESGVGLLLAPDGGLLFINRWGSTEQHPGKLRGEVRIYDTASLTIARTISEEIDEGDYRLARASLAADYSEGAYVGADGRTIYDGLTKIRVTDAGLVVETTREADLFGEPQKALLAKGWKAREILDAAAGRVLVAVDSPDRTKTALWSVDLEGVRPSAIAELPLCDAKLTPSGNRAVALGIQFRRAEGTSGEEQPDKHTTGEIWAIDLASGQVTRLAFDPELSGSAVNHKALCISPDGTVLFYTAGQNGLHAIELTSPGSPIAIRSTFLPDPWTQCLFANN